VKYTAKQQRLREIKARNDARRAGEEASIAESTREVSDSILAFDDGFLESSELLAETSGPYDTHRQQSSDIRDTIEVSDWIPRSNDGSLELSEPPAETCHSYNTRSKNPGSRMSASTATLQF
jgi:hypothetical protein